MPAHAQDREYKSGLNYTTLSKPAPKEAEPAPDAAEAVEETEENAEPSRRVWNIYKDLATGKAAEEAAKEKEDSAKADIEKPEKPTVAAPEKPTLAPEEETASKPNGFQAVLQQWQQSKKDQRDMRSKRFHIPEDLKGKSE